MMSIAFWAAFVGLLAIAGWLLLTACGIRVFGYQNLFCPVRPAPQASAPASDLDDLFRRVQDLERQANERPQCRVEGSLPNLQNIPERLDPASPARPPATRADGGAKPPDACIAARAGTSSSVVVLDGSRSMLLPYDIDPARDEDLNNRLINAPPDQRDAVEEEYNRATAAPTGRRIDAARAAILDALKDRTGSSNVVTFDSCDGIQSGTGADGINLIRSLSPQDGTPIAAALRRAADAIAAGANGNYDGNITLVTDGVESCGGDPCAAAKEIKRQRPGVVINVIDVAGWTNIACVARETGGYVRRGGGSLDIGPLVKDALSHQAVDKCEGAIERARQ
jgi:hypothetical protein